MSDLQKLKENKDIPAEVVNFLDHVESYAKANNITLLISETPQVNTRDDGKGLNCSGFFEDRPSPRLACAIGKPWQDWLPILAHEFSHSNQYVEGSKVWADLFADWGRGVEEASSAIDGWLEGALALEGAKLDDVISRARDVELDCEYRTLAVIDRFNLPIDRDDYAQKAAAYVYFYNHVAKTKQWYPSGGAPYQLESVYSAAPLQLSPDPQTPPALAAAFDAAYPPPSAQRRPSP